MINGSEADNYTEIALLLSCSRVTIDSKHADRIKALSENNIDWNYLLKLAARHGLAPLLFHHLNSVCPEAVPAPVLSGLKNHFNANLGYNRFLTGELLRLLNLFENHGIHAVPFKGPVLAFSVYGDLALREFLDLDIMIRKQDFSKAKDLLISQGYLPIYRLNYSQEMASIELQRQFHFRQEKNGVNLEIFWEFTSKGLSFPVNLRHLWDRLEKVSFFGTEISTFSPEDLLHILCFHGYKHAWESLDWICDIAGLIQTHQEMDWKRVMEVPVRVDSERTLFLGLYLAKDLLSINLPEYVWQKVQSDAKVKPLTWMVYKDLFSERNSSIEIFKRSLFHLRSIETFWKRFQYCYYLAIPPSSVEFEILELPPSLFFLYYLFRPFRLLGKYSIGLWINLLFTPEVSVTKEKLYDKPYPGFDTPAHPRSQGSNRLKQ